MDSEELIDDENVDTSSEGNIQDNPPTTSRKIQITIEPVIAAIFLAQCLSESVLTELLLKRTCEVQLSLNQSFCNELGKNTTTGHEAEDLVQPHASMWIMLRLVLQSVVPAVLSVFLGPWSDRHGRTPVILSCVAGCAFMYSFYTVLAYIPRLHPGFLLVAVIPLSCLGGYVNLITASYCYMSDVSTPQTRALRLGILEGFIFVGMLVGLPISSYLFAAGEVYKYGFLASFGTSAIVCFAALLYTMFCVRESVDAVHGSSGLRGLLDLSYPLEMVRTCVRPRSGGRRAILVLCILSLASCILIMEGESQISYLFTRLQFRWSLYHYTIYSSINKIIIIIGTVVGCWLLPMYLHISDTYLAMFAFLSAVAQSTIIALAAPDQSYFLYIAAAVGSLMGAVGPAVRSVLSKIVDAKDLGKVFALTSSVEAIVPMASSPLYVLVYNSSLNVLPGAYLLLSAAFFFIDFIFMSIIAIIQRKQSNFSELPSCET